MSLWQIEVEKSKLNPSSSKRHKTPGKLLDNLVRRKTKGRQAEYPQFVKPIVKNERPTESEFLADREVLIRENKALRKKVLEMNDESSSHEEVYGRRDDIDQIAQLIIQKSQLEEEMRSREARYESLLLESQSLIKQMRSERDQAKSEVKEISKEVKELQRNQSLYILQAQARAHGSEISYDQIPPLKFPQSPISIPEELSTTHSTSRTLPDPMPSPVPPPPPPPAPRPIPTKRQTRQDTDSLVAMFTRHDDEYFINQFRQLESSIRHFVLTSMASQPDGLPDRELSSPMDLYSTKHNLLVPTIFGIRDIRCIVCRGFIMEFLLERIFRVFLFGLDAVKLSEGLKEGFLAVSAFDVGRGSKWASGISRSLIRGYAGYDPGLAAEKVVVELRGHLAPFIAFDRLGGGGGLMKVVMKAVEVARDCRLEYSSFSLEVPAHLSEFDQMKMESSQNEGGRVAVAYFPVISKRGNKYGEDYQYGQVLVKAKVWRESLFAELQNLMDDQEPGSAIYEEGESRYNY